MAFLRLSWSRAPTALIATLLLHQLPTAVVGLRTTRGSPCSAVCNQISTNTTSSEIVCVDAQFNTTTTGANFQKCIECELESSYQDPSTGETDVSWGIYNLRYAFTSCVYGFPQQVSNLSSQCVVSCQSLSPALEFNLLTPTALNLNTMCGTSSFADNVVDQCEFCYNLTMTQVYLANFLEAVRYNCHFSTPTGTSFAIAPARIFTESPLPTSTGAYTTSSTSGHSTPKNLTLIVALPVLGFVVLVCALTICCFCFIRHRRKSVKLRRQSAHLHARWNDTTMSTPVQVTWGPYSPYALQSPNHHPQQQQQQQQGYPPFSPPVASGYGYDRHESGYPSAHDHEQGQGNGGFGFVDTNGQMTPDVGYGHGYPYAKQLQLVHVTEQSVENDTSASVSPSDEVAVPPLAHSHSHSQSKHTETAMEYFPPPPPHPLHQPSRPGSYQR